MVHIQDLCGEWRYKSRTDDNSAWKASKVPGGVMLDFRDSGLLPNPFAGLNEGKYYPLAEQDWEYERTFFVDHDDILSYDKIIFVAEGLDTYAEISINGVHVASTDNMFIAHRFDVKRHLKSGENHIHVFFRSPMRVPEQLAAQLDVPPIASGYQFRSMVRKAQYSYGWDWGPRIAETGIWRPVYLEFVKNSRLRNPYVHTVRIAEDKSIAEIVIGGEAEIIHMTTYECCISVCFQNEAQTLVCCPVENGRFEALINIANPKLWYPSGYGESNIYHITVELFADGQLMDTADFDTGIRTVKLVREPDEAGESFGFEINDTPIFIKGANWIPADSFLPSVTKERYDLLVGDARAAGINMLRVWGGGVYEDDAFYCACDRLGILVWQDFMYACATYPDELDWFLKNAEHEVEQALLRLRSHPCISLWCGNNEVNWGYDEWWGKGNPEYLGNTLFKKVFPALCAALDPTTPYWISSPYGDGAPNSQTGGDRHNWQVWSDGKEYTDYEKDMCRFASEFGFQAMPCWKTVLYYTAGQDRRMDSPVVRAHNKQPGGHRRLKKYLIENVGQAKDFRAFVYLTQFVQAEAVKYGVEHWRSLSPHTSGTIFWQFNDCWPGASWSCVDYFGRKKALYHYAKKFYAPVLCKIRHDGNVAVIGLANDLPRAVTVRISLSLYTLNGKRLGKTEFDQSLDAGGQCVVKEIPLQSVGLACCAGFYPVDGDSVVFTELTDTARFDTVLYVDLVYDGGSLSDYHVFSAFAEIDLTVPKIAYEISGNTVNLCSDIPAFGVFVEPENDVEQSANCLNLEPGRTYTVEFSAAPGDVEIFDLASMKANI